MVYLKMRVYCDCLRTKRLRFCFQHLVWPCLLFQKVLWLLRQLPWHLVSDAWLQRMYFEISL